MICDVMKDTRIRNPRGETLASVLAILAMVSICSAKDRIAPTALAFVVLLALSRILPKSAKMSSSILGWQLQASAAWARSISMSILPHACSISSTRSAFDKMGKSVVVSCWISQMRTGCQQSHVHSHTDQVARARRQLNLGLRKGEVEVLKRHERNLLHGRRELSHGRHGSASVRIQDVFHEDPDHLL